MAVFIIYALSLASLTASIRSTLTSTNRTFTSTTPSTQINEAMKWWNVASFQQMMPHSSSSSNDLRPLLTPNLATLCRVLCWSDGTARDTTVH